MTNEPQRPGELDLERQVTSEKLSAAQCDDLRARWDENARVYVDWYGAVRRLLDTVDDLQSRLAAAEATNLHLNGELRKMADKVSAQAVALKAAEVQIGQARKAALEEAMDQCGAECDCVSRIQAALGDGDSKGE